MVILLGSDYRILLLLLGLQGPRSDAGDHCSTPSSLAYVIPHDSTLFYMKVQGEFFWNMKLGYHQYADDTLVHLSYQILGKLY